MAKAKDEARAGIVATNSPDSRLYHLLFWRPGESDGPRLVGRNNTLALGNITAIRRNLPSGLGFFCALLATFGNLRLGFGTRLPNFHLDQKDATDLVSGNSRDAPDNRVHDGSLSLLTDNDCAERRSLRP